MSLTIGCVTSPKPAVLKKFAEVQDAFEKGDALPKAERAAAFERMALRFQELIDSGVRTGPMYYNLGNAWAKAEKPGRALAAYQRALQYMPQDPYLASNRQAVLGQSKPLERSLPLIELIFFWQNWIGFDFKIGFSLTCAVLSLIPGMLLFWFPHRILRRLTLLVLALTLIAVASTAYDWYRYEWVSYAVVGVDQATARKGNSERYEAAFTTALPLGTVGTIIDRRGDWLRLQFGDSRDGWLPRDQIIEY